MSNSLTIKKQLNILIIDDNEQITKMISTFLRLNGHKCTISNDGKYGLEIISDKTFDVILLDLAMPDVDGYEILEKMNYDTSKKIIVLTASNISKENQKKINKAKVNSTLLKPIDIDKLLTQITSIN